MRLRMIILKRKCEHMANDCVFCQIIAGKLPATIIHEDDKSIAFFPRKVINPGHVLLMPKAHFDHYIDLPDDLTAHMAIVSKRLGQRIQSKLNPVRVGYAIAGFGITHAHIHIVPMNKMYEVTSSIYASVKDGALFWSEDQLPLLSDDERVALSGQLSAD